MAASASQLVSRTAFEERQRALIDADEKYWQLHTSSRADLAHLEVRSVQRAANSFPSAHSLRSVHSAHSPPFSSLPSLSSLPFLGTPLQFSRTRCRRNFSTR